MKNIFDVLKQKEAELQQLQREIEALRIAARLLAEEEPASATMSKPASAAASAPVTVASAVSRATSPVREGGYSAAWDNAPRQFP